MKKITKIVEYWLLKKTVDGNYYYVRAKTNDIKGYEWFIGYINMHGLVSRVGGELSDEQVEKLEAEFKVEILKRDYCKDISKQDYGDLMTVEDWQAAVADGCFIDDDGCGYWVKDNMESRDEVFNSEPEDATHVMWYNK